MRTVIFKIKPDQKKHRSKDLVSVVKSHSRNRVIRPKLESQVKLSHLPYKTQVESFGKSYSSHLANN